MLRRGLWFGMWCLIIAGPTYAVLPIDRTATYVLYETPGDPESDVKLVVTLHLHAEELETLTEGVGEAKQQTAAERPERCIFAEDHGGKRDKTPSAGHVVVK